MDKRKMTFGTRSAARWLCGVAMLWLSGGVTLAADVVTIHSNSAGTLALTPQALIATRLKVTGNIDARDFVTLKAATMGATQELDLSEATICEYSGTGGSYTPILPDWIVGNAKPRLYRAGEMPVHAFTGVGDNSLTKWHYGATITKIVLPADLRSVSPEAFWKMGYLAEIEVPEGSATARSIGGAVYDRELTRLLAVAPRHMGCLTLPATVTSVADSALHGATLCGIEIKGAATVSFGEQGEFSCPYVIAPNPADYAEAFPGVDVTDKIDEIVVSCEAEGQLARTVGDTGLRAADVRSLTVSGTIGQADVEWLAQLPNLHFLNLAGATFTGSEVAFANSDALCSLALPQGRYALTITDCPFLGGSLAVPEGVTYLNCTGVPMLTAVRLPSTLTDIEANSFNSSLVAEADLSACTGLADMIAFSGCYRLRTLLLPAGLQKLYGADGPVETVTLPEGLRELSVGGWNVETLRLPASLERLTISNMLHLRTLDASAATRLREATGPSFCPLLEVVDFSASPLQEYYGISFGLLPEAMQAEAPSTRVVVTGGSRNRHMQSSLTTLRLPSTLRNIAGDGIVGCTKLTELDLQGCYALESISSLLNLTSLTTLRLPADLGGIDVVNGSPALTDIYLAADTVAPGYGDAFGEGVLEAVTLHVPIGSRGLYFADADWSRCQQIDEYGYTVRTKSAVDGAVLKGAGLYAPGQEVRIEASATAETQGGKACSFAGWSVGGQGYGAPVAEFAAGANVTATAAYTVSKADLDAAHMSFDLTADKPCEVLLDVRSSNGYEVYDGQGRVVWQGGNGETPYSLPAGTTRHAIAIDGPSRVTIRAADAYGSVRMSGLHTQSMSGLLYLEINGMQLDRIDLSTMPGLYELHLGANALTSLDVSPCLLLHTLSCDINQLTELDLTENTSLKYLYCEYNRIRRLAFAPEAKLLKLGCTGNSFGFSQIPDRMQAAVVNGSIGNDRPVSLWYQPPFDPGTGDVLDLSGELFSADGHPVVVKLARDGAEMPPLGGLYAIMETGWYSVEMTCTDMPLFMFWGEFFVSGPSAVGRLPLDGLEIGISGLRVNVGGLPEGSRAALFSAAGAQVDVAAGGSPSLAARQPGVYILRLTDGAGRTQAVKLRLK